MSLTAEETYQQIVDTHGIEFGAKRRERIQSAARDFSDHPGIQTKEIERVLWTGDLEGAKKRLIENQAKHPSDVNLKSAHALIAAYEGDLVGGLEEFEEVRRLDPTNIIMFGNLPGVLIQSGEEARARDVLEEARRAYPNDPDVMASVCTGYMLLEDLTSAREISTLFEEDPGFRFCVIRARLALKDHDMPNSEKWAREGVARNPESYTSWEHLSMLLVHQGQTQEAKAAANFALEINSRSVVSLRNLAKIALREGDKVLALEYEKRASEAVPFMKDMNKIRAALMLVKAGKPDEAAQAYGALLDAKSISTQKQACHGLMQVLCSNRKIKGGEELMAKVESVGNQTPLFFRTKAQVKMNAEKTAEAFATLDAGQLLHPGNIEILSGRLSCLSINKDSQGVRDLAEEILVQGINMPSEYIIVMIPLLNAKENELVDKFYQQLIRKFPSASAVRMAETMIALNKGDIAGGMRTMQSLSAQGEMPPLTIKLGPVFKTFFKLLGRVILIKLGLIKKKPRPPKG